MLSGDRPLFGTRREDMGHHIGTDSLLCALMYLAPLLAIAINAFACEVCESDTEDE